MANFRAIHSVGDSLVSFLTSSFPAALRAEFPCSFALISNGELAGADIPATTVTLLLYRVSFDEFTRNTRRWNETSDRPNPLALNLHYLLTVWADSPLAEQVVLGWTLQQLQLHPILDRSILKPQGGWQADDVVQITPAELKIEDMMRIWDTLKPNYRLSVSYLARVVRIDPESPPTALPVVAERFSWSDEVLEAMP